MQLVMVSRAFPRASARLFDQRFTTGNVQLADKDRDIVAKTLDLLASVVRLSSMKPAYRIYLLSSIQGYGGGMAQYIVAPAEHYYPIPDNVSLEAAALVEPLAVAWHAVNISPFKFGDSVLVLGGGPIGIGMIQVLKLQGAKRIILVELMENRKELGKHYGATHIYDPRKVDIPEEVNKTTETKGADVIFDTAGVESALNGVIPACRVHGSIVNIAVWENSPALKVNDLTYKEVNYMGAALYDELSFKNVIEALNYGWSSHAAFESSTDIIRSIKTRKDDHCEDQTE